MNLPNNYFIILPSNTQSYPTNTSNKFKVQLPKKLRFDGPGWMVGLASIIYPNSWATIGTLEQQYIIVHMKNGSKYRLPLPKGSFLSPEQLESALHAGMVAEFERQLLAPRQRNKRAAAEQLEAPLMPLRLTASEKRWLAYKRRQSKQPEDAPTSSAENALIRDIRQLNREIKTNPLKSEEWDLLKLYRSQKGESNAERVGYTFDDLNYIVQLRKGTINPEPKAATPPAPIAPPVPPIVAVPTPPAPTVIPNVAEAAPPVQPSPPPASNVPLFKGVEPILDLAPWPLHGWMRLRAGRDPHPRIRHLQDRDGLVYELTLHKYENLHKGEISWQSPNFLDHIEENIEEFERIYQMFEFNEHYADIPEAEKRSLLLIAKSIRFTWDQNIGRFVFRAFDDAAKSIAYVTLTPQIEHVLGFDDAQAIYDETQAKYAPDLHGGVSHLCVYMNSGLIESIIMGDQYAQLLQIIAVEGAPGTIVQKDFLPPIFHHIIAQETDVMDIEIRTMNGRYITCFYFIIYIFI
jgi:hypothetical protein